MAVRREEDRILRPSKKKEKDIGEDGREGKRRAAAGRARRRRLAARRTEKYGKELRRSVGVLGLLEVISIGFKRQFLKSFNIIYGVF